MKAIIKQTAIVGENVVLGEGVFIDDYVIIKDNVTIGDNCYIGARSILGEFTMDCIKNRNNNEKKLIIGNNAVIRSDTIIYTDCVIGSNFQTGHHVTIREKSNIGNHVSLGTLSDIQGDCIIKHYVRAHSNVHIGQKSYISSFSWLFPYVVLTNDPTPPSEILEGVILEPFSVISTGSVILPGVRVEKDSLVAAGSNVIKNVHKSEVVGGNPAKVISSINKIKNRKTGDDVYPWRYTFDRGMPWENIGYENWYTSLTIKEKGEYFPDEFVEDELI